MKIYSFYLPQYHPIPENDEWWGKGFTEWTNVTKSKPLFSGHRQPQLPADLGFYDLRRPQVKYEQALLAEEYGVDGFIYYHYWFHGKRILQAPIDDVIADTRFSFPFALCWANETWARTWDGLDHDVLMKQEYSLEDHKSHAAFLASVFQKVNYIKVDRSPLLLVYRPAKVDFLDFFIDCLAEECIKLGIKTPHVSYVNSSFSDENKGFSYEKCSSVVDFQPNADDFPAPVDFKNNLLGFAKKYIPNFIYQALKRNTKISKEISYEKLVENKKSKLVSVNDKVVYPCCFPSWDNSPRRSTPTIIQNDNPDIFSDWVAYALENTSSNASPIVFINAWNEWAEGCHLEPDQEMGRSFLEAVKKAKSSYE